MKSLQGLRAWRGGLLILAVLVSACTFSGDVTADPDIAVVYYPEEVGIGMPFAVSWNILGSGWIQHTNVHWGYSPGSNISDYPNSGKAFTGNAPSFFNDTTLKAPMIPGRIYLRVHLIMEGEYISSEFTINVIPQGNMTKPAASIISYPMKGVSPGARYNITWQVTGGRFIDHTNVHWGTRSGVYPYEGEPMNSTSPQIFTNTLIAPDSNTKVYFVIHYKVDGSDYYTSEYNFQVGVNPNAEVTFIHYPMNVVAGGSYNISWRIEGGIPGNISLTRVVWGKKSNELTMSGKAFSGNTPAEFEDTLTAPVDTLRVYFKIHYVVDTIQGFSPEYAINVTGGVQVVFRFIQSPPAIVRVDKPFIVSWTIEGGNRIEMTRFEWGTVKGLHPNHGNEFAGRPGDKFTDQINISGVDAPYVYYVVYYRVDGVEFTSPEGSFHPYYEGSGLNYLTGGVILLLIVITLMLAYIVIKIQQTESIKTRKTIGITEAKRIALEYLVSFYKVRSDLFRFYDAYPAGDEGFEVAYTSPKGSIRYRVFVDRYGNILRLTGGTKTV